MEKHIYLVRHGQSESNLDRIMRGEHAALSEKGFEQARLVADRVAKLGVEALISSPFIRTFDTARAIHERAGLVIESADVFREWGEPTLFYGKHEEHPDIVEARAAINAKTDPHYRHTDEETFAELQSRAVEALAFLQSHPAERLCVVSHFGIMQMIAAVILFGDELTPTVSTRIYHRLRHANTGITYIKYAPGAEDPAPIWQVVTWNDQSHFG